MDNGRDTQSARGVPNAEAGSANTLDAMSPMPHKLSPAEEPMRLQHPLSLHIDGLNAVTVAHGEGNSTPAYIESSERGSDTSVDSRRPDLHSASTLTDSLFSFPSSTNGTDQPTQLETSHKTAEHTPTSRMDQEPQDTHMVPQTQPVNGCSIDRWQPSLPPIKAGNASLSPPPSPKHSRVHSNFDTGLAPSQKRTAAGDHKPTIDTPVTHSTDLNGVARRRSKSTGSSLYGNRIAQVILSPLSLQNSSLIFQAFCTYPFASFICSCQGRAGPAVSISRRHSTEYPSNTTQRIVIKSIGTE